MDDAMPADTEEPDENIARLSDQKLDERITRLRAACGDFASDLPENGVKLKFRLFMYQHEKDRRLLAAMSPKKDVKIEESAMSTPTSVDIFDENGSVNGHPVSTDNIPTNVKVMTSPSQSNARRRKKDNFMKNTKLSRRDFNIRDPILEMSIDFKSLESAYPGLTDMFEAQGWVEALSNHHDTYSPLAIREFYFSMERLNESELSSTVSKQRFVLKASAIALYMNVQEVDIGYLNVIKRDEFLALIPLNELQKVVLQPGVLFTHPVQSYQLIPMAYAIWEIIKFNILPQRGHHTEISYTGLYIIFKIMTKQKISLPTLMINHMFRCRNQAQPTLPYGRMITHLIQQGHVKLKRSDLRFLIVKRINFDTFARRRNIGFYKDLNIHLKKKRKFVFTSDDASDDEEEDDTDVDLEVDEQPAVSVAQKSPPSSSLPPSSVFIDSLSQQMTAFQASLFQKLDSELASFTQHISELQHDLNIMKSKQQRALKNQEIFMRYAADKYGFDLSRCQF